MRVTTIYYLFQFLFAFAMGSQATLYVPFLLSLGLTLSDVALVNVLFWAVIIAAELPTGMLADGKSRAWSLKLGGVFCALGFLSYAFAQGFWSVAVAEALEGIGQAFLSGALGAWLADALKREQGSLERLRHISATDTILSAIGMVIGAVIGALLGLMSTRLVFVIGAVFLTLAALAAHLFMNRRGEPEHRVGEWEALRLSVAHLRRSRDMQWIVAATLLFGAVVTFNHYWTPFFSPDVGALGLSGVWALMHLSLVPSGFWIRRTSIAQGKEAVWIVSALVFAGVGLSALGSSSGLLFALLAMSLHEIGRGLFRPLSETFVQHRVESHYRATFGSLNSFLGKMGLAIAPLIVGIAIADKPNNTETIRLVWSAAGVVMLIGAALLWLFRPRTT